MTEPPPAQHPPRPTSVVPSTVLVVGAGPTGLTAAHLLGSMGVRVLLIERNATTSDDAKAISLDDESLRTLQTAGLDEAVYPIIVPGTGTRYFGVGGRPLVHARGTGEHRYGHPFKNAFAQPNLERVLRAELARFPHVEARFGTRLVALEQGDDRVRVSLRSQGHDGPAEDVDVAYVLGCDGGRSTVRELLTIPLRGRSFPDDVWLVADTLEDSHDQRYGMHVGDPGRPVVIIPGLDGRCRYEFRLRAGECTAGSRPPFELIRQLLRPYREIAPGQVERTVAYTFHALLAERLRESRCFLLGDAAHMMPPFAGQGLNSGVRDASNLCWKIGETLAGRAGDALLDTYDTERRPHAREVIELSVRLGRIVMTNDRRCARLRDLCVRAAMHTGHGRRYLTEMRYRPDTRVRDGAVVADRRTHPLVGTLLRQPDVLHGPRHSRVRLDDVLGVGWSLLGIDVTDADWAGAAAANLPVALASRVDVVLGDRAARERDGRTGVADADGRLDAWFSPLAGHFALVRPDRLIAAVFPPSQAERVAARLRRFAVPPNSATASAPSTTAGQSGEQPGHRLTTEHDTEGAHR